jgi:hypothetical protein
MDLNCEFLDRRQGLDVRQLYIVIILMYMDGFEMPITEG